MEEAAPQKNAELQKIGNKWLDRIVAAGKRESTWMKDAEKAEKAYTQDDSASDGKLYDFNILHSNVETIVPAIYNSTPVPDVRSRNTLPEVEMPPAPQMQPGQQPDPRAMAQYQQALQQAKAMEAQVKTVKDFGYMIERAITVQIDDNKLDTEIEAAAQDAFLSGRGIVRIRFQADFPEGERTDDVDDEEILVEAGGEDEAAPQPQPVEPQNERIVFEAVSWRDFRRGPAKRWDDLPWMAFRHSMASEEFDRIADKELLASQAIDGDEVASGKDDDDDIVVWEIWCRDGRYVKFVRESDGRIIREMGDPLGLTDFFPIPKAIQPIALTGKLTPVCPFSIYKKLADELDLCTKRINAIMRGLKVRGLIAGDASDIEKLARLGDNELGVATGLENLAQTKGIDGAIMWWPIEQAIRVLKELYVQREQTKQAIYELTGISDIVRGASNAGETATAQQIKTQWGSLRIQKMQRLIQRLVRDLFIMSAEIITSKFSARTLTQMTGIEITPQIQQLMDQRVLAYYRVDVESDSTVKADTTRIRGEMNEFLQGTGAFFGAFAPIVQSDPASAGPVAAIYQSVANNFNLGKQVSTALDELTAMAKKAKDKPRPNPEQEKLKAEMELKKADHDLKTMEVQAGLQAKQQEAQIKARSEAGKMQADERRAQIDLQKAGVDLQIKQIELQMKERETAMNLSAKATETSMKLDAQRQSNALKAEQARQKKPANAAS